VALFDDEVLLPGAGFEEQISNHVQQLARRLEALEQFVWARLPEGYRVRFNGVGYEAYRADTNVSAPTGI
jgi:hypothetical protein